MIGARADSLALREAGLLLLNGRGRVPNTLRKLVASGDGRPQTITQPVELPDGVSYEGVFGDADGGEARVTLDLDLRR